MPCLPIAESTRDSPPQIGQFLLRSSSSILYLDQWPHQYRHALTPRPGQADSQIITAFLKARFHVKVKLFQRILVFYFNMEPRLK